MNRRNQMSFAQAVAGQRLADTIDAGAGLEGHVRVLGDQLKVVMVRWLAVVGTRTQVADGLLIVQALLCTGLLTSMAWAQEFPQTPKQETLVDAIKFEKYKIAAAEAQAKKDAAESARVKQTARTKSSSAKARKLGQADAAKR